MNRIVMLLLICLSALASAPDGPWPAPMRESRPWTYWWWMASAVDQGNITRELERYRAAGFGGVHIIPIYGALGYEDRYIEFLSPRWMEMLAYTAKEAERLDMGLDMTTGTGWCFGGPNIAGKDACTRVVWKRIAVGGGGRVRNPFPPGETQALVAFGPDGQVLHLTPQPGGGIELPAAGRWTVFAVSQQQCAEGVKRAAPGGEGPMLNPFFRPAADHYLERFSKAFESYFGRKPRAMYHDSFEYEGNWAPDLFEQFARRRGYRLDDHLDVLFDAATTDDRAARVKSDYRETVSDLLRESFTRPWVEWAHREGFIARDQAHGSPGNWLDLYAAADIPETEMFRDDRSILVSKFASSAAHVAGRTLVSSETGTWLKEHFNERPADLKKLVDELFLAGINHVFFHGTCYSPDDAPWPGWLFYASTQMNPRNSIWRDVPALSAYITRVQSILQKAKPAADVLLYWPVYDYWHDPRGLEMNFEVALEPKIKGTPFRRVAQQLTDNGFAFDLISDRQIAGARAERGSVVVPGGAYRAVVVPATAHLPLSTASRLIELARAGAAVVFEAPPGGVPGWRDAAARTAELGTLWKGLELRGTGETQRASAASLLVGPIPASLAAAGIHGEPMAAEHLVFVRSRSANATEYFVVNRGPALDRWVPLRGRAASVLLMDPLTGVWGRAATREGTRGTEAFLQLAPGASVFLRVNAPAEAAAPSWPYRRAAGPPTNIEGNWTVEFVAGGPDLPPSQHVRELVSWTMFAGAAGERFAGTARYTITFDRPAESSGGWLLDLGAVAESARVRLNGADLGTLIAPPYRVVLLGLRRTANVLEVDVTNLTANRIRDLDRRGIVWRKFHDINFVNQDYRPFDASGWPLAPSGLLGPVTVTPVEEFAPA